MSGKKKIDQKPQKYSYQWAWWSLLIIILITALIRYHLLGVPLERDEGEYAYAGQLILQGIFPYAEAYNMKMPGIYAAYALILAIFGQTHIGIHLGLLFINAATIILVFLLGRKVMNETAGAIAAAVFGFLSLSQKVQGFSANTEHFVILAALLGILLLLYAVEKEKWYLFFLSGFLLGLAFILKQHGLFFVLFGGFYLVFIHLRLKPFKLSDCFKECLLFFAGAVSPFLIVCLVMYLGGVFEKFWFWTFTYAREYASSTFSAADLSILKKRCFRIFITSAPVCILAGIGLSALFLNKEIRHKRFFLGGFFIFSFLSVFPGFYFRAHYFIFPLPSLALLCAAGIVSLMRFFPNAGSLIKKGIPVLLVLISAAYFLYQERGYLFLWSPTMVSRMTYGGNPFVESIEIAKYIKENSTKNDRIAVIGSEPQIYFYADRRSATGYIYTYALMERHNYALTMQKEMIKEIETNSPLFLVFVGIKTSWLMKRDSKTLIFDWFEQYIEDHYRRVGVVEIVSLDKTIYKWGEESIRHNPRSKHVVFVFKKRD